MAQTSEGSLSSRDQNILREPPPSQGTGESCIHSAQEENLCVALRTRAGRGLKPGSPATGWETVVATAQGRGCFL